MSASYLSTREVAARCGVHPRTVRRWIDAGMLPAMYTSGGHRRVDEEELKAFLESRRGIRVEAAPVGPIALDPGAVPSHLLAFSRRWEVAAQLEAAAGRLGLRGAVVRQVETVFQAGLSIGDREPAAIVLDATTVGDDLVRLCAELRNDPATKHLRVAVVGVHHSAAPSLATVAHVVMPGNLSATDAEMVWRTALG